MKAPIIGISLLCLSPAVANAQEAASPSIVTERPSVGTGTDLVPMSWIVVENGLGLKHSEGAFTLDGSETLIRYRLSKRVELRWAPANAMRSTTTSMQRQDGSFTVKTPLLSSGKWPVSFIFGTTTPTGGETQTSGAWDPTLLLTTAHTWSPRFSGGASYNAYWTSSPTSPRSRAGQLSLSVGWNATARIGTFVEYAPLFHTDPTQAGYTADTGVTYMRTPLRQWDARIGYTRAGDTGSIIAGVGYSFMLPSPFRLPR